MATKKRRGERKDGLIQVALDVGYNPDGSRRRKYFYGRTRAEAIAKREKFRQALSGAGLHPANMTVSEWVDEYKQTYRQNVNPLYYAKDDTPYNRLVAQFGNRRISEISEADLQRSLNALSGMSFSTCEKYRQTLKRVFARARRNKLIADDPAEDLILPPHTKGTHRALETWEIQLILNHWHDDYMTAGLWVMLMLFCGLRRSEMMALEWDAVDMENRLLEVRQVAVITAGGIVVQKRTKTADGRRVLPICSTLYNALSCVPEVHRTGFVCLSAHGLPLTESAVSRGLETFCKRLERIANNEPPVQNGRRTDIERLNGTPEPQRITFKFRAHDLRHTYATMLYDAGVDVKSAQYFLGHADLKMTLDLYTHLSNESEAQSRQQAIQYLDSLIVSRLASSQNSAPKYE